MSFVSVFAAAAVCAAALLLAFVTRAMRRELQATEVAFDALDELGAANRALADEVTRHHDRLARVGDAVAPEGRS